jgi:predicted solute-binding protein
MITASELRKSMESNKNEIIISNITNYCLENINKEVRQQALKYYKNHYSYYLDSIQDKRILDMFRYCIENDLRDDVLNNIIEKLNKHEFKTQKLLNGIAIEW